MPAVESVRMKVCRLNTVRVVREFYHVKENPISCKMNWVEKRLEFGIKVRINGQQGAKYLNGDECKSNCCRKREVEDLLIK